MHKLNTDGPFSSLVNELSNTMDLPSTLLRAQALFRRFQRTVEAIDKKDNFPTPAIRQRKLGTADSKSPSSPKPVTTPTSSANTTGADARRRTSHTRASNSVDAAISPETMKKRIISPELRALLSRKVEKLDKKEVEVHGGGVGSSVIVPAKLNIRDV